MSTDRIADYYRLCTVRLGDKKHIIDSLSLKIDVVFTKKEIGLYFRKHNGYYIAHDSVVGAAEENNQITPQKHKRDPIIMIGD